ncbi:MBL fold metallo-hydrolase [Amphibacillus sp. Q70]|uniref:MBL fold metallo-hydrolase n=1 Tax=Amphibacillus sp. Q70 TaxID=3453416 RepID=UPI003F862C18
MKVTVVGFWGAYPAKEEATSSYMFEKDGFRLLVDCGSGALAQLPKYLDPYDLDAVVLSHYHPDHMADIGVLQHQIKVQNQIRGQERVLKIYGHHEDQAAFAKLTAHPETEGVAYQPEQQLELGPFTIGFLQTLHPVTCYAMRITAGETTVVYTADSSYQDLFIPFCKNADLLITDCNFYEGQDGGKAGHMNSKENGLMAEEAAVKTLLLSHQPHFGPREQLVTEAKKYFSGQVKLAHTGYQWSTSKSL